MSGFPIDAHIRFLRARSRSGQGLDGPRRAGMRAGTRLGVGVGVGRGDRLTSMTQPSSWSHYAAPRHAVRQLLISCHGAGEQSGPQPPFRRRRFRPAAWSTSPRGTGNTRSTNRTAGSAGPGAGGDLADPRNAPRVRLRRPGMVRALGVVRGRVVRGVRGERAGRTPSPGAGARASVDDADEIFDQLREAVGAVGPRAEIAASVATQRLLLGILDAADPVDGDDGRRERHRPRQPRRHPAPARSPRARPRSGSPPASWGCSCGPRPGSP